MLLSSLKKKCCGNLLLFCALIANYRYTSVPSRNMLQTREKYSEEAGSRFFMHSILEDHTCSASEMTATEVPLAARDIFKNLTPFSGVQIS